MGSCNKADLPKKVLQRTITDSVNAFSLKEESDFRLELTHSSNSTACFYISPEEIDFRNYQSVVNGIVKDNDSESQKALKIWRFTSSWSKLGLPPARNREPCDPLKLFNSLEYALCGGINGALANLFTLAGLKSRVYNLQGHVVAETFYDGSWHMFDADRDIYFTNKRGEVADVEYISNHPELIETRKDDMRKWAGTDYSYKALQKAYSSASDNQIDPWFTDVTFDYKNEVKLAPNERLSFELKHLGKSGRLTNLLGKHSMADYDRKGILHRIAQLNKKEYVLKEESPYAITTVHASVSSSNEYWVYYSLDSIRWYFKGLMHKGKISFNAVNEENEVGVFQYYLKLVLTSVTTSDEADLTVENDFLFSDKIFINATNSFKLVSISKPQSLKMSIHINEAE